MRCGSSGHTTLMSSAILSEMFLESTQRFPVPDHSPRSSAFQGLCLVGKQRESCPGNTITSGGSICHNLDRCQSNKMWSYGRPNHIRFMVPNRNLFPHKCVKDEGSNFNSQTLHPNHNGEMCANNIRQHDCCLLYQETTNHYPYSSSHKNWSSGLQAIRSH